MLKQGIIDTIVAYLKDFFDWLQTPLDMQLFKWHIIVFFVVVMTLAGIVSLGFDVLYGLKWLPIILIVFFCFYAVKRYKEKNQPKEEKAEYDEAQLDQNKQKLAQMQNDLQKQDGTQTPVSTPAQTPTKNVESFKRPAQTETTGQNLHKSYHQGVPIKEIEE